MEKTFVFIKPDGVERNLIGEIIRYYEKGGLKVTSLEMTMAPKDIIEKHYPESDEYLESIGQKAKDHGEPVDDLVEYGRKIVGNLKNYVTRSPIVKMILEGENAVSEVRRITGFTDPTKADAGTIRADFGQDSIAKANAEGRATENMIHASGNPEEAEQEIALWF